MEVQIEDLIAVYAKIPHVSYYHLLLIVILLDIVTGHVKAFITKKYNSHNGIKGMLKHGSVLLLVFSLCPYLTYMGFELEVSGIVFFFIGNYGLSIIENFGQMGIKMPPTLTQFFTRLKEPEKGEGDDKDNA